MPATQNGAISVAYADVPGFPTGSVVDHITVSAVASNPANSPASQSVAPGTPIVTFVNLPADTYVFSAQAFPATGPGFGTAVTASLTITALGTVSLSLPSGLTATQP